MMQWQVWCWSALLARACAHRLSGAVGQLLRAIHCPMAAPAPLHSLRQPAALPASVACPAAATLPPCSALLLHSIFTLASLIYYYLCRDIRLLLRA